MESQKQKWQQIAKTIIELERDLLISEMPVDEMC
jgi:hypothetical protein